MAVLFLLVVVGQWGAAPGADASIRKAPYLIYTGSPTEIKVLWQLSATEQCTIEWGFDETYALGNAVTSEYGPDHQHAYTVPALAPGAWYCYRVTAGSEQSTGTFRAAPAPGTTKLKFFAYGDTRTYPADHDAVAASIIRAYTADPELQTLILCAGDLVYNGDLETDWDSQFFGGAYSNIRSMLAHLPYQACMGNHENTGAGFVKYFPYPFIADRYWSFDYGPAHFAVVDQYVPYDSGSVQLAWLEDDLAATARPWKFVLFHEPGWSAGYHSNDATVQTCIQPLCEEYGVTVVFAGHNHYYARAVVNGVQHITTGGGGAPLKAPVGGYPNVVDTAMALHHCEIEIDGGYLYFKAVTPEDSVIDYFDISLPGAGAGQDEGGCANSGLWLGTVVPNPFRLTAAVSYSLPQPSAARLAVYNVTGQLVTTLLDEDVAAGPHDATWDGRDAAGRRVSAGLYLLRLEAGGARCTTKVMLRD